MISLELLLQPLGADAPCGEDIAFSPEVDEIARARVADDPTLDQGAWETELREADWHFVASRCAALIEKRSKDLRLAAWLAEAAACTSGFGGLAVGLQLLAGMCDQYWQHVHPQPDENGHEQRIGNLCWIAVRMPPLIGAIRPAAGAAALAAQLAEAQACRIALAALEHAVDERLGAEGPGFSGARKALDAAIDSIGASCRAAGGTVEGEPAAGADLLAPPAHRSGQALAGPVQTRAQALAQLRAIADYFRHAEPHSPVAYLADKAAEWGTQPLHVWLRAVVKEPASVAHLEELLGVPKGER